MDLHDYQDVAENYDAYLDVMYKDHDNYEGFQDFYLGLAREYGGGGTIDIKTPTLIQFNDLPVAYLQAG